jgi:competence protein ComEC
MRPTCILAALTVLQGCATDHKAEQERERDRRMQERIRAEERADDADDDGDVPPALPARPVNVDKSISVHLLDVGQGAATLIEFPCGAMLIDTGGEMNESFDGVAALIQQLEAFFARRTDLQRTLGLLVITHPHIDHMKGIPALLQAFKVQNVVDNGLPGEDLVKEEMATLRRYVSSSGDKSVGYRGIKTADIVKKSGYTDDVVDPFSCSQVDPVVRVLSGSWDTDPGWGTDNYGHLLFENMNNHSVVVRVDAGNASVLITGDLEKVAIAGLIKRYRDTRWLDVDVYEAGHHGSANGTTRELMAVMTPSVALIPAGSSTRQHSWTAWAYGHPRNDVVDMLTGVAQTRPRVDVAVGKSMKRFLNRSVDRAIFSPAWDGAVVVDMTIDGVVTVRPPGK